MLALLNNVNRHNFINYAIEEFVEDNFAWEEISEIENTITKTEIKNLLIGNDFKNIPKFNLKVYAYVYNELIIFPRLISSMTQSQQINFSLMFIDQLKVKLIYITLT